MTVQTQTPCAVCNERHVRTADGWYAGTGKDRHPFTPMSEKTAQLFTPKPEGYTTVMFGVLAECEVCHCVVENRAHALAAHRAWHRDWVRRGGAA